MEGLVRLNLGCGDKLWEGFINCDFEQNWSDVKPDVSCDIRKLPFPDDYADEIHAIHVIEHFHRMEVEKILKDWMRVLKPGGKLVLECPCLDKIAHNILERPRDAQWVRHTLVGLYGEYWLEDSPDYTMMHKWCYSELELTNLLMRVGYNNPVVFEPHYHKQDRDMRVVSRKHMASFGAKRSIV